MRLREIEKTILNEVVFRYIRNPEPIGSVQLKEVIAVDLSSATIRNYFRRLVDEGLLTQLHASSGRIPTDKALQSYWQQTLDCAQPIEIDAALIEKSARAYGLYALLQMRAPNRLQEVVRSKNGQLMAAFENGAATMAASSAIERLLGEFTGYDLIDLMTIAQSNRIDALYDALRRLRLQSVTRFNPQALIGLSTQTEGWNDRRFDAFYGGEIADALRPGVFFETHAPLGCAVVAQEARIGQQNALLVAFGPMTKDYQGFMNHARKGDL